jgi:hypothetical protein
VQRRLHRAEEIRPLGRRQIADRAAQKRDQAPPAFGQEAEVTAEIADHRVHLEAGVLADDRRGACTQRLLADVEGHEAPQMAGLRERVHQEPRLLGRTRAELDQCVGAG